MTLTIYLPPPLSCSVLLRQDSRATMSSKPSDLVCAECGSNRLRFPQTDEGDVTCEDCGDSSQSLSEVKARIAHEMFGNREGGRDRAAAIPAKQALRERHTSEVDASQTEVRESIAETDRLVVESDRMLRRHRKECDEAESR